MKNIIIAIDGHSACGKSTLARQLAEALRYIYIDTGAMYRAVTYYFLQQKIHLEDQAAVRSALDNIDISFNRADGQLITYLNGQPIEEEIRKMPVSRMVSPVAAISAVRAAMVDQQRKMGKSKGIVMDGRDIGTVVFPQSTLKLFVTATIEARTKRRYQELSDKGVEISVEQVQNNLLKRDYIDSTRTDSPLKQAEDAILIDNTNLNREEQLEMVKALALLRMKE